MSDQTFWNGFFSSFSLILASELGDKTFLTTSIFSIVYPRMVVFLSSMLALTTMNILSILLGMLTTNISPIIIHYVSVALFFIFGAKMIIEGCQMDEKPETTIDVGLKEVEKMFSNKNKSKSLFRDYLMVFLKIFSLIFLAEWGDKSQLSTILLATKESIWSVGLGSFCGNFVSNAIAVLCSRVISQLISTRSSIYSKSSIIVLIIISNFSANNRWNGVHYLFGIKDIFRTVAIYRPGIEPWII